MRGGAIASAARQRRAGRGAAYATRGAVGGAAKRRRGIQHRSRVARGIPARRGSDLAARNSASECGRSPSRSHHHTRIQTLETAVVTTTAGRERAFPPRDHTRGARPVRPARARPRSLHAVPPVCLRPRPRCPRATSTSRGTSSRRDGGSARPLRRARRGGDAGWGGHDRVPLARRRRRGSPRALPHPAARVPPRGRSTAAPSRRTRRRGPPRRSRAHGRRTPPSRRALTLRGRRTKTTRPSRTSRPASTPRGALIFGVRRPRIRLPAHPPPSAGPSSPLSATAPSFPRGGAFAFSRRRRSLAAGRGAREGGSRGSGGSAHEEGTA